MRRTLRWLVAGGAAATLTLAGTPALAHDGEHTGHGAHGPTQSLNMRIQSNSPPSVEAVQSDLAFTGKYAIAGNYAGLRILDTSAPAQPRVVSDLACNGAQSDVSVYGHLVVQSVDRPQSSAACDSRDVTASTPGMFEGLRVFDISDVRSPRHVASIPTACGSHTHTLLPEPEKGRLVAYVSSYPLGGVAVGGPCRQPHGFVSIVDIPIAAPAAATVSRYHLDPGTQTASYFGGAFAFTACHDISVFKGIRRAAAACMSEAQLWDISDPLAPRFLWRYDNDAVKTENVDLFHSATFTWDGSIVAFGDESGGGGAARCTDPDDEQGRIWFVRSATGQELGSYKIPRAEEGTCTMHNFNFVPGAHDNVLVASAYTGGTSVVRVGDGTAPREVAFYRPEGGDVWSSYWYNGRVYANDINRGLDTYLLSDSARAGAVKLPYLNPQTQMDVITRR